MNKLPTLRLSRLLIHSFFDQCEHGQLARTPTKLVALRLPTLKTHILNTTGRVNCSHVGGHEVLAGRGADGQYRTLATKVYLRSTCRAIANAFGASIDDAVGLVGANPEMAEGSSGVFRPLSFV
jgi:hypothetical protein